MAYRGTFASAGDDAGARRLVETQLFDAGAAVVLRHPVEEPVLVRPVVGELLYDWMASLEQAMKVEGSGVIGVAAAEPLLAAALARDAAVWLGDGGRRVTLVDASISSPVIGKALMEDGDEGLVDAVVFGVSPRAVARRTLASGIRLVTAGSYPVSARAVFESENFARTLRAFDDDGLVIVALDSAHVDAALPAFSAVVAAGRTEREVELIGRAIAAAGTEEPPHRVALIVSDGTRPAEGIETPAGEETTGAPEAAIAPASGGDFGAKEVEEEPAPAESLLEPPHEPPREPPHEPPHEEPEERAGVAPAPSWPPADEEPTGSGVDEVDDDLETEHDRELGFASDEGERRRMPPHPTPVVLSAERRGRRRPASVILMVLLLALVPVAALIWWRTSTGTGEVQPEEGQEIVASGPASPGPPAGDTEEIEAEGGSVSTPEDEQESVPGSGEAGVAPAHAEGNVPAEERDERPAEQPPEQPRGIEELPGAATSAESVTADGLVRGPGGPYFVFVSSHKHEVAARMEGGELEARGYEAVVMSAEVPDRGVWHRVAVAGGYPSFSAAREVLDRVKELGYEGAWVQRVSVNE